MNFSFARGPKLAFDAEPHKRMYPAYTMAQLKAGLEKADPETRKKMEAEIAARESGVSQVKVTPQIEGGKAINKVGRM